MNPRILMMIVDARRRLAAVLGRNSTLNILPEPRREDDLFLVAYPKSGVTWLTFLVANANIRLSGDPREVTFFNILDFVADIHVGRRLGPPLLPVPGYRCIKSHAAFTPEYKKVIYLIRDPRSVMASYFAYMTQMGEWNGSLEDFVVHPKHGIRAWISHVSGWVENVHASTSFALFRYEDLLGDTIGELRRLYRMLGWSLDNALAGEVVERAGIERMREAEALFNSSHPGTRSLEFVRPAKRGGARVDMPENLRQHIAAEAGLLMRRFGYDAPGARIAAPAQPAIGGDVRPAEP